MRIVIAAFLVCMSLLLPLSGTSRAYACSCMPNNPSNDVNNATFVVVGTIAEIEKPLRPGSGAAYPVKATVQVERYLKGAGGPEQTFASSENEAGCGFVGLGDLNKRHLLFLRGPADELTSNLCSGNMSADDPRFAAYVTEIQSVTGPGTLPTPRVASSTDVGFTWTWIAGGVILLFLVLAAAVFLVTKPLRARR